MGVEDITASLVKKGQSKDKTLESFRLLRDNGIIPVPMMMHHDSQPLVSWKSDYGLLNQLRTLRKAGAIYTQVLMLTPSAGSKWLSETFTSGAAFEAVDGKKIEPHTVDGNYVVASKHPRPWLKQFNLLIGYTYFFNPLRFLIALFFSKSMIPFADAETRSADEVQRYTRWQKARRWTYRKLRAHMTDAFVQILGIMGLIQTYRRTLGWALRLFRGNIQRAEQPPRSRIPMRSADGGPASHALPGTVLSDTTQVHVPLKIIEKSPCSDAA
jgi:hypothetical protein